jgi:hypothetical protein
MNDDLNVTVDDRIHIIDHRSQITDASGDSTTKIKKARQTPGLDRWCEW